MNKLTRRKVLKLWLLGTLFPKEVLSSINWVKDKALKIISFNTQRDYNLDILKQDLSFLITSLLKGNENFIIWLQEVCSEIFSLLEELTKENWLRIERWWTKEENVTIFSNDIQIKKSSDLEIERRKILKIETIISWKDVLILNWDFDYWIAEKTRRLRYNQLLSLLSEIKDVNRAIITIDTNFLLEREKRRLRNELKQINWFTTSLDSTYNPSRLEEVDIEHILWKIILQYIPILNMELDKIITKGFKITDQFVLDNIKASDHYPIIAKLI